jgi:hypothetical protein
MASETSPDDRSRYDKASFIRVDLPIAVDCGRADRPRNGVVVRRLVLIVFHNNTLPESSPMDQSGIITYPPAMLPTCEADDDVEVVVVGAPGEDIEAQEARWRACFPELLVLKVRFERGELS